MSITRTLRLRDHYGVTGLGMLIILVGALVVIVGGCVAGINYSERIGCEKQSALMHTDHDYGLWTGCLVRSDDGRWVPLENYRVTRVDS